MIKQYLQPTFFLDFQSEHVIDFSNSVCCNSKTPVQKAVALYYAVRDQIRYDPYDLRYSRTAMKASSVLEKKSGYCVAKAVLLAAGCRRQGIASRLGFADVTNHLSTKKLRKMMETATSIFKYRPVVHYRLFSYNNERP